MQHEIRTGDTVSILPTLAAGSVDCVVTSPPYWALRDYGIASTTWPSVRFAPMPGLPEMEVQEWSGSLGLEPDVLAWVGHLVHVFRLLRPALKPTATVWLNLGDKYVGGRNGGIGQSSLLGTHKHHSAVRDAHAAMAQSGSHLKVEGLKAKDLVGLPWRAAFALQADGWWVRSDIIHAKPNPQPESCRDRPTRSHDHLFMLALEGRGYHYDFDAISERVTGEAHARGKTASKKALKSGRGSGVRSNSSFSDAVRLPVARRNARSVWWIQPGREQEEHTATFAPELARRAILAGCPSGGLVLDPFSGLAHAGVQAVREGRRYLGIELNPRFAEISRQRLDEACRQSSLGFMTP